MGQNITINITLKMGMNQNSQPQTPKLQQLVQNLTSDPDLSFVNCSPLHNVLNQNSDPEHLLTMLRCFSLLMQTNAKSVIPCMSTGL